MSPVTVEISDGNRVRVVHVNRMQPRLQAGTMEQAEEGHRKPWSPPQVDHYFEDDLNVDNQSDNQEQRYPRRERRLPERYGVYFCHACGQASSKEGQV